MARCFLTGVEFRVADGSVLNRGDAHRLLRTLRKRADSLERIIAQLSPLDMPAPDDLPRTRRKPAKRHRMICKTIADALANAYPEIELFLTWPAHHVRRIRDGMQLLGAHPIYGTAISGLTDEDLVRAAKLGRDVLRLVDPLRKLPLRTHAAIRAGICVRHRTRTPQEVLALIRSTIADKTDLAALGIPQEEHEVVGACLVRALCDLGAAPALTGS